ncbi:HD domain-containing protein [Jonesia quinghaiensis]|uniref:HD domain-containing protein n=1 Tax=Jonesia quinghaiensis TaxID=262806 RepID=UPI00042360B0|nr:hypothetical protein [Jonesia quinghaiensis]
MFTETTEVPQWLLSSWLRSCHAAGATANEAELIATCRDLIDRWNQEDRCYHGVKHLVDVLSHVDELASEAQEPDLVRLAAWYHGAVFSSDTLKAYANEAGEDEVASGALARNQLTALGIPTENAERVSRLITTLVRHKAAGAGSDCAVLCDADLAVLKSDPQRYKQYIAAIREEYSHIPVVDFVKARLRIVSRLLDRSQLFTTAGAQGWEEAARQNLIAERARLNKELKKLDEASQQVVHSAS